MQHTLLHPLSSSTFANLLQLLSLYGYDQKFILRVLYILGLCLLRQPFLLLDSRRYHQQIEQQTIEPDPVFIIGHWRSGTTHLQNFLAQDEQFGRVSLLQASMPHDFLALPAISKTFYRRILPAKRIMDNVTLSLEMPWEEELAMASYCQYSFYHVSFFPRSVDHIFRRAVLFDGNRSEHIKVWKRCYTHFLKKVQITQPGKRLLLKNPANTARISLIRGLFPQAKFIYIHRHPYEIFTSTMHLYAKVQSVWGLQSIDRERLCQHVLKSYRELMDCYLRQRSDLDERNLVEISYQDLETDPLNTIQGIYGQLELENYRTAKPHFLAYLEQQQNYRKNTLSITGPEKAMVYKHWQETFNRYGYTS